MLKAMIIDNGIGGSDAFPNEESVEFVTAATGPDFNPYLTEFDLFIVPNGTDQENICQFHSFVKTKAEKRIGLRLVASGLDMRSGFVTATVINRSRRTVGRRSRRRNFGMEGDPA